MASRIEGNQGNVASACILGRVYPRARAERECHTAADLRTDPRSLQGRTFDLAVVGGGIQGASIAREAAMRGARVLLVEAIDFASGTSSRSSRLVHGGLRYLASGRIGLVREALAERERLLRLAPHLVRPVPLLLPSFSDLRLPRFARLGVRLYAALAGRSTLPGPESLSASDCLASFPGLRSGGLLGGVRFFDAATQDARLTLANVRAAAEEGAACCNHCRVVGFRSGSLTMLDAVSGDDVAVNALQVVNATGPHVDTVRRILGIDGPPLSRISRGSHLVLPRRRGECGLAAFLPDRRIQFAIPHRGGTICGTTEIDDELCAEGPSPSSAEIDYILDALALLMDPAPRRGDVSFAYAGWRALPACEGPAGRADRRPALVRESAGRTVVWSVVGGKLTTHRSFGERAAKRILGAAGRSPSRTRPLPGCSGPRDVKSPLWWRHGAEAFSMSDEIGREPPLGEPLCPHRPFARVEAVFALREHAAVTFADLMLRRLCHEAGPCLEEGCLRAAHELFLQHRRWPVDDRADVVIPALIEELRYETGGIRAPSLSATRESHVPGA
ncbi:MAG: glycerol-3-phosphate dehydrogenase [Planctomycetota bacterium]